MNFLNLFEERVSSIFGAAPQGYTAPFSFKKLAKKAAHEMENETFSIDGVDTAPALYTILVSPPDDAAMRPLYAELTRETAQFIEGQAQRRGYAFVGEPLVRFMVDPTLKSGRFSVFAENVDARALSRLRAEESAYLAGGASVVGGAAAPVAQAPRAMPRGRAAAAAPVQHMQPVQPMAPIQQAPVDPMAAGLDVLPADQSYAAAAAPAQAMPPVSPYLDDSISASPLPAGMTPITQPRPTPIPGYGAAMGAAGVAMGAAGVAGAAAGYAAAPVAGATTVVPSGVAAAPAPAARCLLIDRQTGQTYAATAPRTIIGRERASAGIVLRDPNISRRHAELSFDGQYWHIQDLNSTNGTIVNNVDVDDCVLRDGDLVTLGLMNLEFREG